MAETPAKKPRKTRSEGTPASKPEKAATAKAAPAATKTAVRAGSTRSKKTAADADLRQRLIIETAYYLSEKRRGHCTEQDDWLFAETLVDSLARALK